MASLKKIKICGIRSFGPEEEDVQTIKFQKPLTLIIGENGCGKSTIIECLRYLTAQKEPPGKSTFVHDPTLTSRCTVKGFVKLQILDAKGNQIDLCRQLQATKSKKTLTTKSLDNVITRTNKDSKEKQSISNRCADFTYEISRIFGVSRAILENVIFCTQEDSHWPLETDQKLKEKFDQIFDSEKYNKCVSKVRELMKKIKGKYKISEVEIKYLEENKKLAGEKRREIERTRKKIQEGEEEISKFNMELKPIYSALKEINEKEMLMSQNYTIRETKKAELKEVEKFISELKNRIGVEFEGSDEELKEKLSNFSRQLQIRQTEISKLEEKVIECNKQEMSMTKELMAEQGKLGQLQKEEEINKERLRDRNQSLNSLAVQLEFDSLELSQEMEDSVQYLLTKVQVHIKGKKDYLQKLKEKNAKEESDVQHMIDKLREEALNAQNDVTNKERDIRNKEAEIDEIKNDLLEIEKSATQLSNLETQLSNAEKAIRDIKMNLDVEGLKSEIGKSLDERNRIEKKIFELEEVVRILQQNCSTAAELEVQKELMSSKEVDLRRLLNKHEDNLNTLLDSVPTCDYKIAVQNQIEKLKGSIKELTSTQSRKEKELVELETKRKHMKEEIRQNEEKLLLFEEEIYEECGSDDFDEVVANLQSEIDELQDVKGTLSSSEYMYQKYIQALKKPNSCCPLCHRDFSRQNEAEILVQDLTLKVREVPAKLLENKNNLEKKQTKYRSLLALRLKHEQIVTLKSVTLPTARSELEKIESALKKTKKELEDIRNRIMPLQADEAICTSLQGDMAIIDQLNFEKKKVGMEIKLLESRLENSGNSGNLEKKLEEQEELRKTHKTIRDYLEDCQSKLNKHNEELQSKQSLKNLLLENINKIQGGTNRKKELNERLSDLKATEISQAEELKELKRKSDNALRKLKDTISSLNIQKRKNSDEEDKLSKLLSTFEKQLQDIQTANNYIQSYESKGIKQKFDLCQTLIKKLEANLSDVKVEKEKATNLISDIKRDLYNQENRKRELQDNLKYRERVRYCEEIRNEVAVLEKKCGNIDFSEIMREKKNLKEKEEEIGRKKAQIQGRMGELDLKIEQLEQELLGKMLKNVEAEYKKELLNLVVLKSCAKDLERYATTMEYAMMTYHKTQMTKVNAFIREYWRKIYQGNDVDYIEIQTDIASTDKRRNYSYKVVQMKNEACLDFRNRCSAGQKMLASLIIRMALAETFSSNCGILTLDEPTTNLDRRNIKNLAEMLCEILKTKESLGNKSFQLIVITHDEEFVRMLADIDNINEYVCVRRNDRGKTRISREIVEGGIPGMRNLARGSSRDASQNVAYD